MTAFEFIKSRNEILTTDQLHWQERNRTFVAEVSELDHFSAYKTSTIILINPNTRKAEVFVLSKIDKDASGEDIYGWRYLNEEGTLEILIIND